MPVLTHAVIKQARPRLKKYEIPCSAVRGLALRVLPSGKKVFVLRIRGKGAERRERIGLVGQITLEEAQRHVLNVSSDPTRDPAATSAPGSQKLTPATTRSLLFRDLAREYIERHVETDAIKPSTRKNYRRAVRRLLETFGDMRLKDIRFADVEAFHRSLAKHKAAANYQLRVLNHMFAKAAQWDMYPWGARLPTAGLKYFREQAVERFLSPNERVRLERVLDECLAVPMGTRGSVRWSHVAAIRLLSMTGFREGEILDLEWTWIDRRSRVIRLPNSKTGKSVRPVSSHVLEYLAELERAHRLPGCPFVIYGRNQQRVNRSSLTDAWRRIRRRANLDDLRVHDLRRSAASDALNAGVALEVVSEILGHKSIRTTKRYAHIANRVTREGTERMGAAIEAHSRRKRKRNRTA